MISSREIFYVTIVLCLNISMTESSHEIIARQTRTGLRKHDVIKVCNVEYLASHK